MKVLVLGAGGMLGSAMFSVLSENPGLDVSGTLRTGAKQNYFLAGGGEKLLLNVDVQDLPSLRSLLDEVRPQAVINCVGVIKQLADSHDALISIAINSLLPHQLAELCGQVGARLVHFSTDCVFSGRQGNYAEGDFSDAEDLYGRSKFLGEVSYPHALTMRTSIIGHELGSRHSLVDWFLAQTGQCNGYTEAFFSGFPSVELARIVSEFILPNKNLSGLYQVAAERISKYDLLSLIAEEYDFPIKIVPSDVVKIDRSLNGSRFNAEAAYTPPDWPTLIKKMHVQFQHRNDGNVQR